MNHLISNRGVNGTLLLSLLAFLLSLLAILYASLNPI